MKKGVEYFFRTLAAIILLTGCSANRNTSGTRAFHELSTRYNIHFNAQETYNDLLKERTENLEEDYTQLLPLFPPIPSKEEALQGGVFDPVIEKTEKAIREHSITAKPQRDPSKAHSLEYRQWLRQQEFNPFLKHVWLLRGKAYLQNGNLDEALAVFTGMLQIYAQDDALVNETEIWLLRTYTEMGRWYEAEKTVYTLINRKLPSELHCLFTENYAYFLLRKEDFQNAIPYLQEILSCENNHIRKKKIQFIIGQILSFTEELEAAYIAFEKVKGLRTPFDLSFYATIWQSAITEGEKQQKVMQQLKRMERKTGHIDSLTLATQRNQIYLTTGKDDALFSSSNDNTSKMASTGEANATTADKPKRLSTGRTLAENAALQREWRSRNALWQYAQKGDKPEEIKKKLSPLNKEKSGPHALLLIYSQNTANKNEVLFAASNFNFSRFKLRKFDVSPLFISRKEALQIKTFYSFQEALEYQNQLYADSLFLSVAGNHIKPIILSEKNIQLLLSGETMEELPGGYPNTTDEPRNTNRKREQEQEKIVSLEVTPDKTAKDEQQGSIPYTGGINTPEALKQKLEENATKALQQEQPSSPSKSRKQLMKERQQERKEKIRQKELKRKEKIRKREEILKEKEKKRKLRIREQE